MPYYNQKKLFSNSLYRKSIFLTILVFRLVVALGQDSAKATKIDFRAFDRLAFVGTNFQNSIFLYLDGPRVLFNAHKKVGLKMGVAFFPTMYYNIVTNELTPKLGVGPRLDYKKIVMATPFYVIDDGWRIHAGIGYKF